MATNRPRITVTLTERQHECLRTMSELQRVSMSSIVGELLEMSVPVFERVCVILRAASDAPEDAIAQLKKSLCQAEEEVRLIHSQSMDQLDLLVDVAERGASGSEAAAPRSAIASDEVRPQPSNRGVRITNYPNSTASKAPSKTKVSSPSKPPKRGVKT